MNTRNLILSLSDGAIDRGSFKHVLRCRRNSATRLDAMSACRRRGTIEGSPGLSPDPAGGSAGDRSGGSPSITWYLTERSGCGRNVGRRWRCRLRRLRLRGWPAGRRRTPAAVLLAGLRCGGVPLAPARPAPVNWRRRGCRVKARSGVAWKARRRLVSGATAGSGFFCRLLPTSRYRPRSARRSPNRTDAPR